MRKLLLTIAAIASVLAPAVPASAAAADLSLYRGKTVNYIVATGPGGGYDTYARLLGRYMQKYLPGSRFIVRNVPGAGHIVGANTLYVARPDGLTIGTFNTGLIYDQLLKRAGARFDLTKFGWIGSAAHDMRVLVISNRSGFKNFKELADSGQVIRVAAAGVGSAAYNDTRIVAEALHLKVQIIPGFEGNEGEMSMLRGEVIALLGAASTFENFVNNGGGYYALAVSGDTRELPGVPRARDFVTEERGGKLLELIEALSELGRLTAAPPGVPANMLEALREAYAKALADPALRREAEQLHLPIDPAIGAEVERRVLAALDQSPESIALLKEATAVSNP